MPDRSPNREIHEYLCVDNFLYGFLDVQSLKAAFEIGLIDLLSDRPRIPADELPGLLQSDPDGIAILVGLLKLNNVIEEERHLVKFSPGFKRALEYRDLLAAKIEFSDFITPDMSEKFGLYIRDPGEFMNQSRLFDLFSYHRCYRVTGANLDATGRWVRYTTALTRYETPVCLYHHDFSNYRSMLDIGGNSGEFALQVCGACSGIRVCVVDLPVVCELGQRYLQGKTGADRVSFHAADALVDDLPTGFDIVTLKSVLHDWPEDAAGLLLTRAAKCLEASGTVLIFERARADKLKSMPAHGNLPVFLFNRHYRNPAHYHALLAQAGFAEVQVKMIQLEMPFMLISAKKW